MTKDQEILNILLELEKNMVKNIAVGITEASSKKLAENFQKLFTNSFTAQRKIFDYMNEQGWYQLTYEPEDKITKKSEKLNQTLNTLEEI